MAALEQLCDAWPPATEVDPSSNQGTMTLDGYIDAGARDPFVRDPLVGLHHGAWWTGIKILSPRVGDTRFRVEVIQNDGSSLWSSWTQDEGDWTPLPWPIPAHMAKELGLCLKIKQVGGDTNGAIFTRRVISFLECPGIPIGEPLLFVDDDGDISGYWGPQMQYGSRSDSDEDDNPTPHWGTPHTVVPESEWLITHRTWTSHRTMTPSGWDSAIHF
jgi:hypothetical protein